MTNYRESMYAQQFKFYATEKGGPAEFGDQYVPELENVSVAKDVDTIRASIRDVIVNRLKMDPTKRYVAVGNAGDCVIYENDEISQMSDSG